MNTATIPFFTFIKDENGAVTVDWIVLTAAIVGLGAAVMTSVGAGATDLATGAETALEIENVSTASDFGPYTRRFLLNRIKGNGSFAKGRYQQARSLTRKIQHEDDESLIPGMTFERDKLLAEYDEYRRQQDIWRDRLAVFDAEAAAAAAAEAEAAGNG